LSVPEQANRSLQDIVQWCAVNTATQVGLENQKGMIAVGYDADFCVFDDTAEWVVEPSTMLFRNKCSPYQGRVLKGMVLETWLRGEKIFLRRSEAGSKTGFFDMEKGPRGRLLLGRRN
jgi:allantoinase